MSNFVGLLDSFMFFCCKKNFIEPLNIVCGTGGFWNQQKGSLRAHVYKVQVKQELLKWNRIIAYTNYFRSVSSLQSPPRLLSLGLPCITWPSIWTCQMYTNCTLHLYCNQWISLGAVERAGQGPHCKELCHVRTAFNDCLKVMVVLYQSHIADNLNNMFE